jgi:hypothetical protein
LPCFFHSHTHTHTLAHTRSESEGDEQTDQDTKQTAAAELDLTNSSVMTDRIDIPDCAVQDGINKIGQFRNQKGTSDGHKLQLVNLPPNDAKHWTTSFCGVGQCSEKLVRPCVSCVSHFCVCILQRFRDKEGLHNCWKKHKSKTYRLGYDVKVTAVDCHDPLKQVCFGLFLRCALFMRVLMIWSSAIRDAIET